MVKKLMSIEVRGKASQWGVNFHADASQVDAMRADGLDVMEVMNVIPGWVMEAGLARVWMFFEDVWNFRWPFYQ